MSSWRRTYWAVWIANLVTAIGMMSFLPFFPSLLEEMGVTDEVAKRAWAGIIFGAAPLSATVMSPIWGALGDRIGRKLMVCRSLLAISIFVGGMYWAETPATLLLLRIGQGLFSGFIPPSITLVSVGAPPERQGRVAGDLTTALALGGLIGPGLGGWLAIETGSRQAVFLFVGAAGLVSALLVALMADEDPRLRQERSGRFRLSGALRGTWNDVRSIFANPLLRATTLVVFALQLGLGATNPLLELHTRELVAPRLDAWVWLGAWVPGLDVTDRMEVETLATSLLFSGMAVVSLLALPLWGRYGDRVGHRGALALCALLCALSLGLQAAAWTFALLLLGRLAMGAAIAGTGPLAYGLAAVETGASQRGGAFGVVFSARTLAVALGAGLGGFMSSVIGVRGVMVFSGLVVVGALWFFQTSPSEPAAAEEEGPESPEPIPRTPSAGERTPRTPQTTPSER